MIFKKMMVSTAVLFLVAACQTSQKIDLDSPVVQRLDVEGHRGSRATHPENTLPALIHALEVGADTLEFDLGVTKDNVLVVVHDPKINPVICQPIKKLSAGGDIWIHKMTLKEVKNFDCGTLQNPRFPTQTPAPGTKIPTLEEVFTTIARSKLPNARTVRFNIETKSEAEYPDRQPDPETFVKLILKQIKKFKVMDRVTLQSFDHRTIVASKRLAPQLKTSALYEVRPAGSWVEQVRALKADVVSPDFKLLNAQDITDFHDAGIAVIPWTANTAEDWLLLIDMGVDGIITDDPASLLTMLGRRPVATAEKK